MPHYKIATGFTDGFTYIGVKPPMSLDAINGTFDLIKNYLGAEVVPLAHGNVEPVDGSPAYTDITINGEFPKKDIAHVAHCIAELLTMEKTGEYNMVDVVDAGDMTGKLLLEGTELTTP